MKYTIPALIALGGAHAWDAEYDGFYHWKIWDAHTKDSTKLHEKLQFTNGKLPLDVSLDWCAAEPECEFITYQVVPTILKTCAEWIELIRIGIRM